MINKQTCVIVDSELFQKTIDELFGIDELGISNYRIEEEVDSPFYGKCGLVRIWPQHKDWNEVVETLEGLQQIVANPEPGQFDVSVAKVMAWMSIEDNVMATLICRGVIPEDADLYLVDFDWM